MLIALISGSTVTNVGDYREIFPDTSFPPSGVSDEFLLANSAKKVNLFKAHDSNTHKLVSCEPYIDGEWVYLVTVENKTAEEIAADTQSKASQVRANRNALLSACDWTQLPDVSISKKTEWATYRQALRDITNDSLFPNVTFPNNPDYVPRVP
jgi:hypothetical protein